jgi:hypothetical protein
MKKFALILLLAAPLAAQLRPDCCGFDGDITAVGDCSTGDCYQTAAQNQVYAGPASGGAGQALIRALVLNDIPDLSSVYEAAGITESDISDLGTLTAMVADNLSVFASTTILQLAGILSDEDYTPGSESGAEAVLDLQELQGAVTDAQVPNDITIAGTGDVGIGPGNTSPGQLLDIYDTTPTTGVTDVFIQEGAGQGTDEVFGVYANDGTTARLVVQAGEVGIGTTDPDEGLEIANSNASTNTGNLRISGDRPAIRFKEDDGNPDENFMADVNGGDLSIGTNNDAFSSFSINFHMEQSGNIGIGGETNPTSALHVPDGKYFQDEDSNAGAPASGDCDAAAELGRQSWDSSNLKWNKCGGASGWYAMAMGGTSGGIPYYSSSTETSSSGALAASTLVMGGGAGAAPTTAAGYTVDATGSGGTAPNNAGTSTELARSDHEHLFPWQVGMAFTSTPSTGDQPTRISVPANCGGNIEVTKVRVLFNTKGSGNMTFQGYKCTNGASESCSSMHSGGNQTYSNAGNVLQDFDTDQNDTSLGSTDFFKINIATVNGQDDGSITIQGQCQNI